MSKNFLLKQQTITDIADAIRDKKGTTNAIAIEDLDDEIKSISAGQGGRVEPFTFISNGVYDTLYATEEVTITQDTVFDFEADGLQFLKCPQFSIVDDVNIIRGNSNYTFTASATYDGVTTVYFDNEALGSLNYGFIGTYGAYTILDEVTMFSILWVKDATALNTEFGSNIFEDNMAYITNILPLMAESEYEIQFDSWAITIKAPGKTPLNGVMPITINVTSSGSVTEVDELPDPNLFAPYSLCSIRKYGIGMLRYNDTVNSLALIAPCVGAEVVDELPTENIKYSRGISSIYIGTYYYLKPENEIYLMIRNNDGSVTPTRMTDILTEGLNIPFTCAGTMHMADAWNIPNNSIALAYAYDYYINEIKWVNGVETLYWKSLNTMALDHFDSTKWSISGQSIVLDFICGEYDDNQISFIWSVDNIPLQLSYVGSVVSGVARDRLSINKITDILGEGTFTVSVELTRGSVGLTNNVISRRVNISNNTATFVD